MGLTLAQKILSAHAGHEVQFNELVVDVGYRITDRIGTDIQPNKIFFCFHLDNLLDVCYHKSVISLP